MQVGGFMPKDTLTQISRDLRSTHFNLGSSGAAYETAHQQQYRQFSVPPTTASRPRDAHLSFGQEGSRFVAETEMNARYTGKGAENRIILSQEAKNELRAHHFGMGADRPTYVSHHMDTYGPKQTDLNVSLDSAARIKYVRKAHFELGSDPIVPASVAKTDFTPKTVEKVEEEKFLAEMRKGLRISHFLPGNSPQTFLSTARKDFTGAVGPSSALNSAQKANLRREHFVLGTDQADLSTVHQDTYTAKTEGRQALSIEKLKDLRSSHFALGQSEVNYHPVSHAVHRPLEVSAAQIKVGDSGALRQSHFTLGTDPNSWKSVSSTTHQVTVPATYERSNGALKARESHFVLGNGPRIGDSSSHQDYVRALSAQPNRLDPQNEKSLRGHHFQLGMDPTQRYQHTNRDYGSQGGPPNGLDEDRKKDLRTTHFQYGSQQPSFQTSHNLSYVHRPGQSVSPERAKNTRKSHFDLSERKEGGYSTTYKGTYNWIQPQPDRNYKFSIQQ